MPRLFPKVDIRIDECSVSWKEIAPGLIGLFLFSPVVPQPVGTVYVWFSGKGQGGKARAEILDSYVIPWARRQGVRSRINRAIFEDWGSDVIVSQAGTKDGEAWMRAVGYEIDPKTGLWFLNRPTDKLQ